MHRSILYFVCDKEAKLVFFFFFCFCFCFLTTMRWPTRALRTVLPLSCLILSEHGSLSLSRSTRTQLLPWNVLVVGFIRVLVVIQSCFVLCVYVQLRWRELIVLLLRRRLACDGNESNYDDYSCYCSYCFSILGRLFRRNTVWSLLFIWQLRQRTLEQSVF